MKEQWKPVVGLEGQYEVSTFARVRSLPREWQQVSRLGRVHAHRVKGRMLKPGVASNGYYTVALGRGNTRTVHSLVAEAFIGPCPKGQEVRHKNGKRTDSRLVNLEYGTRTDNIRDAIRHGTWVSTARAAHLAKVGFGGRRRG